MMNVEDGSLWNRKMRHATGEYTSVLFNFYISVCSPFRFRVLVNLKKSTDKSSDTPENEKAMVVDIIEHRPENVEKSTEEESLSKEAPSEGSSEKEGSNEKPEESTENVVNNKSCSYKTNDMLELIAWLHDSQLPLSDQQLSELHVELDDFRQALKCVQPSAKREGFATVPDVTWDDVGSLRDIREELQMTILVSKTVRDVQYVRFPSL
jgi:ribosome biogenesis ATPase